MFFNLQYKLWPGIIVGIMKNINYNAIIGNCNDM